MGNWSRSLLVILFIGILVLALTGCSGGATGPEDAVKSAFKALESKNAQKLISYYVEDVRDEILADTEYVFSIVDTYKVSNLVTTVVSSTGDTASVEADYDLAITVDGQKTEQHVTEIYELAKVDGKWLLLGEATEVEVVEDTPEPTATQPPFVSPEGTVLEYYTSMSERNIGAIQRCFREDFRNTIVPSLEEYFSYADTVSIYNIELEVTYITQDTAVVDAIYDMYIIDNGEKLEGSPVEEDLYLEKIQGKWLIAEDMGLY